MKMTAQVQVQTQAEAWTQTQALALALVRVRVPAAAPAPAPCSARRVLSGYLERGLVCLDVNRRRGVDAFPGGPMGYLGDGKGRDGSACLGVSRRKGVNAFPGGPNGYLEEVQSAPPNRPPVQTRCKTRPGTRRWTV